MPSVMDRVAPDAFEGELQAGAVVPLERHLSTARGLWPLSHGGSLYLVVTGANGSLWLIAVLEAPEQSQLKARDRRARGWYAPANVTPITDLTGKIKVGRLPRKLTDKEEALLRELLDEVDAPLVDSRARESSPAIVPEGTALERAVACLVRNDSRAALGALLEAWREVRVVALADLIDRVTRVLPGFDRPLAAVRYDDASIDKAWDAAFESDATAEMPQLLHFINAGSGEHVAERWKRLASLPDDPRIARGIAARGRSLVDPHALALLERTRDATSWAVAKRAAPEVEIVIDNGNDDPWSAYETISLAETGKLDFANKLPAGKLPKAALPLIAAIETQLERLEAPCRMECDLVDAIAEDWKADGPRAIYADWLIERGHPRGEYLSLVLRGEKQWSPAQRRRFALLSDVPYLYGMLDEIAVMQRRVRDRGIDRSLDVYWSTGPLMWNETSKNPLVRALTKLRLVGDPRHERAEAIAAFVKAAPQLAIIEDVDAHDAKHLTSFLGRGWKHDPRKQQLRT